MEVYKIAIKIFAEGLGPDSTELVPVFHRWIQTRGIEGHLLIDVADYAHVVDGPGTVLISSEANFYMERQQGRLGLLYSRKLSLPGSFRDRLRAVILETFKAAAKLEQEPSLSGKIHFRTDEILIRLNDRLRAPNNEKTLASVKTDAQAIAAEIFGSNPVTFEPRLSPLTLFEIRLKAGDSPSITSLLDRLNSKTPALS